MTREQKLALIVGFALVLLVGVLISDHFSHAAVSELEDLSKADQPAAGAERATQDTAPPADRVYATTTTADTTRLPDGFRLDGDSGSRPEVTVTDRPVFASGRDALLNELRQSWQATQEVASKAQDALVNGAREAVPAVEMNRPQTSRATLPEPASITPTPSSNGHRSGETVRTHRVAEDESLWGIAERYYGDGALYTKLAEHNSDRISNVDAIPVGTILRIPVGQTLTGERSERSTPRADRNAAPATYTVREGDSLGEIAQRLLGSAKRWPELVRLNGIEDPDVVPVGTVLKLPASR